MATLFGRQIVDNMVFILPLLSIEATYRQIFENIYQVVDFIVYNKNIILEEINNEIRFKYIEWSDTVRFDNSIRILFEYFEKIYGNIFPQLYDKYNVSNRADPNFRHRIMSVFDHEYFGDVQNLFSNINQIELRSKYAEKTQLNIIAVLNIPLLNITRQKMIFKKIRPRQEHGSSGVVDIQILCEFQIAIKRYFESDDCEINTIHFLQKKNIFDKLQLCFVTTKLIPLDQQYILFMDAGEQNMETVDLGKYCEDMLQNMSILKQHNLYYTDFKYTNTVYCNNRYRFIDWGGLCSLDKDYICKCVSTFCIPFLCTKYDGVFCATKKCFEENYSDILQELYTISSQIDDIKKYYSSLLEDAKRLQEIQLNTQNIDTSAIMEHLKNYIIYNNNQLDFNQMFVKIYGERGQKFDVAIKRSQFLEKKLEKKNITGKLLEMNMIFCLVLSIIHINDATPMWICAFEKNGRDCSKQVLIDKANLINISYIKKFCLIILTEMENDASIYSTIENIYDLFSQLINEYKYEKYKSKNIITA